MNPHHPYWYAPPVRKRGSHSGVSRREWLARSAGVLGLAALGDWPSLLRAEQTPSPANLPQAAAKAPALPVAIQRCLSYEPALVRERLDAALDGIGGIGRLVRDKTVTVKINMTGAVEPLLGLPASQTYQIHPHVVGALCAALDRAGARRIAIVEAWYYHEPVQTILTRAGWDIPAIEAAGGHKVVFENTRNRGSWGSYSEVKVPWGGYLFPAFELNGWYDRTDVFVSLGKMKDHAVAGITMATKNIFGITPTALYGDDAPNEDTVQARVGPLHMNSRPLPAGVPAQLGANPPHTPESRVPRIVADLLGARPIDLALIDGVETITGGEGPWIEHVRALQPRVLFAGRNAVCTDSVCAAAMGYDARAGSGQFPFPGENHLRWAAEAGLGSNDVGRIEIAGLSLKEARCKFRSPPGTAAKPA
ncbi:MAG TPA: DUF362 domain-containing protein [Verrucomicrobiae bacterium]|nr:DUF362 domain-containing protein [Verrucomicrobiae bacterium]